MKFKIKDSKNRTVSRDILVNKENKKSIILLMDTFLEDDCYKYFIDDKKKYKYEVENIFLDSLS